MSSQAKQPPASQVGIWFWTPDDTVWHRKFGDINVAQAAVDAHWRERRKPERYGFTFDIGNYELICPDSFYRDDSAPSVIDELDMAIEELQHAAKKLRENDKEKSNAPTNA